MPLQTSRSAAHRAAASMHCMYALFAKRRGEAKQGEGAPEAPLVQPHPGHAGQVEVQLELQQVGDVALVRLPHPPQHRTTLQAGAGGAMRRGAVDGGWRWGGFNGGATQPQ